MLEVPFFFLWLCARPRPRVNQLPHFTPKSQFNIAVQTLQQILLQLGSLLVHTGFIGGNHGGKNLPNMIDTYNMYYVVGLSLAFPSLDAVQLFIDIALQINRLKVVSWILHDYHSCNKSLLLSNINQQILQVIGRGEQWWPKQTSWLQHAYDSGLPTKMHWDNLRS